MRSGLLLVPLVLGLGGAAWVLWPGSGPTPGHDGFDEGSFTPGATGGRLAPSRELLTAAADSAGVQTAGWSRIGVLGPADRAIPIDPRATPLENVRIRLPAAAPGALGGEKVLAALAEHFLVRARSAEDLAALKSDSFALDGGHDVRLPRVVHALQQKGYFVRASEGRVVFVVGRFNEQERSLALAAGGGDSSGGGMGWRVGPVPPPSGDQGAALPGEGQEEPQHGSR